MKSTSHLTHIDRLGASVSFACAVHCAITPFAATILPLLGIGFLADEGTEHVFLAVSVALAAVSVCWGVRIHRQRRIVALFVAALFLIFVGRNLVAGTPEIVLIVLGASLFVTAHILNRRLCSSCRDCH
jgi:hypothetical protein